MGQKPIVGSNPTLSATLRLRLRVAGHEVVCLPKPKA